MSPETYSTPESFEQRAHKIKEVLLRYEEKAQEKDNEIRQELMPDMLSELGINEDPADISDLVDNRVEEPTAVFASEFSDRALPVSEESAETTRRGRHSVEQILQGEDDRLIVIIGPCSIHDITSALEYADWVAEMREEYGEDLEIIMRVYTEKPRTVRGWKGLALDPDLTEYMDPNNPKYDYPLGLVKTRMLLNLITHRGVPAGMERLNTLTPQYTNALSTYDALGARNSLDPNGRAFMSGTSAPAGSKHPPDGSIESGLDTVDAASHPGTMLGNTSTGVNAQLKTKGNPTSHLILRGGNKIRNYHKRFVDEVKQGLIKKNAKRPSEQKLVEAVVIDASHANSDKDYRKQYEVVEDVAAQVSLGETAIKGLMIESNLVEDRQDPPPSGSRKDLRYGQSITDGCVGLEESKQMLKVLAAAVRQRREVLAA